jgi:hypothetical protein
MQSIFSLASSPGYSRSFPSRLDVSPRAYKIPRCLLRTIFYPPPHEHQICVSSAVDRARPAHRIANHSELTFFGFTWSANPAPGPRASTTRSRFAQFDANHSLLNWCPTCHDLIAASSSHSAKAGYLLPDLSSGATGISGRFSEGLLLRRLHLSDDPIVGLPAVAACPARPMPASAVITPPLLHHATGHDHIP